MNGNSDSVRIMLSGIGGYGNIYVGSLLDSGRSDVEIVGAVDPHPEGCRRLEELRSAGVPIFASTGDFFAERGADLAVISSPIFSHAAQTVEALEHGCAVLCEKPLCATSAEAEMILEAERRAGSFVAVGYQWSYSEAILGMKRAILDGTLGAPKRLAALVRWPRSDRYFSRNSWAGKVRIPGVGWVFDSVANNAAAHYLHDMLFVLGHAVAESVVPVTVTAELYRANDIENFDTAGIRITVEGGTELLFLASHAVYGVNDVSFRYEFADAVVSYGPDGGSIEGRFRDGGEVVYGDPYANQAGKLWAAVDAWKGGPPVPCPAAAAVPQVGVITGARSSFPEVSEFPASVVERTEANGETFTHARGLETVLADCYDRFLLPSEAGAAWARAGNPVYIEELVREILAKGGR